jgi:hypothetical protein
LIKPIFIRLSSNELLSKCLDGETQNQNESINGMIWNRIPKNIFVGFDVLELGSMMLWHTLMLVLRLLSTFSKR